MRRSAFASRVVLLLTVAALAAGLIGVTPVLARDPAGSTDRFERLSAETGQDIRTSRGTRGTVNAASTASKPDMLRPVSPPIDFPVIEPASAGLSTATEAPENALAAPVEPTTTTHPPAAQPGVAGIDSNGPYSQLEPPDPWVAAGPDHVVQTTNVAMRILDRNGNTVIEDFPLADFFQLPGGFFNSDPRIHFDSLHQRWLLTEVSWTCDIGDGTPVGFLDILVSDTADPTGNWTIWWFGYDNFLPDYPALGSSTNKLAFGANFFQLDDSCDPTGLGATGIVPFDWNDLLNGGAPGVDDELDTDEFFSPFGVYFTPRVAMQTPATSSTLHTVIQSDNGAGGYDPAYISIVGSAVSGTLAVALEVDMDASGAAESWVEPPDPQQPGSPATVTSVIDARPSDAIWQGNRLLFVSNYGCTPAGDTTLRSCVRVTEVTTNSTGTVSPAAAQDFLIAENGKHSYYGGIGLAGNGTLYAVWTQSSTTAGDYPSSMAAYQLPGDAANSLSPTETLATGLGTYDGISATGRWGDYVGVAQDPQVPNAVWQANQYSGGGNDWLTHVSQLQTGGSSFVPIAPLRIVDTRPAPNNVQLTGKFLTSVPRAFDVAGQGTIPDDAVAVTGNVTVTGQNSAGFVSITLTPTANPPSSTINFPLGDTRANNFTIPLNQSGGLAAVYRTSGTGKSTNLIIDITGYFLAGDDSATYATLTPTRVMDTRPAPNHVGPLDQFAHGVSQVLPVAGVSGVPGDATAITANLTVVGQNSPGYFSLAPDVPVGQPSTSTLNFPVGDTRANGVTVDLNGDGDLAITLITSAGASGRAHALLDVTGYYVDSDAGLLFYPLNPGRVLDSRSTAVLSGLTGLFSSAVPRELEVAGHWGAPLAAEAVTGNLTVASQTAGGLAAITTTSQSNPATSTLNFPVGDTRANGVTVPLNAGDVWLVYRSSASGAKTHLLLDLTGYFK